MRTAPLNPYEKKTVEAVYEAVHVAVLRELATERENFSKAEAERVADYAATAAARGLRSLIMKGNLPGR